MPELAEVATYARDLNAGNRGNKLTKVLFPNQRDWGNVIVPKVVQNELRGMVKNKIQFSSYGKALVLNLEKTRSHQLEIRLGMTGRFQVDAPAQNWRRHCFLVLEFSNCTIYYLDPRRFGRMRLPAKPAGSAIGGYAIETGFWRSECPATPAGYLRQPRVSWLLGTGAITGVGNYMANEALGRLNLSPFAPCKHQREAESLLVECGRVAEQSFLNGGNSFSPGGAGFANLGGERGNFSEFCLFYKNPKVPRISFRGRPVYSHFSVNL
ncbi:MAG TPA: DNA-formamidopyrimidine glycosylase family protein [Oligoflexia bacterium]|nr:DNA-formamidopyrimidine glycosylase family protein [Oligoflexia bacterium]